MRLSELTESLLEAVEDISHDPDDEDAEDAWFEVDELIDGIPVTRRVLKEILRYIHAEYL
jgi:hypothetical protein